MSVSIYLKRSATASKRPLASGIALGELALNYDSATGGLYYKDSADNVVKVGPAQVSSAAPNSSPAGSSGNSVGEFWYDTMTSALKVWNGASWTATNTNSSYVANSAYTAKGVLLVGSAPNTPIALAVGTDGYVLVADSAEASGLKWVAGGGGVTSITAGTGLTGGTITTTGTIALATSGVSAGSYTFANVTVDTYGRVTAASDGGDATTSAKGVVQVGTNIDVAAGVVSVADASTSTKGVVQLTDSTSSTSATTAATPNAVKTTYDLANAALPKAVFTAKGDIISGTGSATYVTLPVGTNGQVLSADSTTASGLSWISVSGTGTVTSITAGTGLSGGTITTSGTIALADTAVAAGSYTNSSITVDAQGRLTAASSGTAPVIGVTATSPITSSGGTTPVISTSMATNRLLGRSTAGTGVAEEIAPGTNLTLSAGTLSAPAFATTAQMQGVATTATATSGATTITVASGTGIVDGDAVYGVGIVPGTAVTSGGGTTSIVLDTAIVNTLSASPVTFNTNQTIVTPGDAGAGLAKAWVKFNANSPAGTWPGGASTVARASGSTTATITTTNNHGLSVGSRLYALTGVAPVANGFAVVSVTSSKIFTITTAASTLITAGTPITFYVAVILNSYNIHSVVSASGSSSGSSWYFNFATPMLNDGYITVGMGNISSGAPIIAGASSQTLAYANMNYYIGASVSSPTSVNSLLVFG